MKLEKQIKSELKNFLAALAHQNRAAVMEAHKNLYEMGASTLPFLEKALFDLNLSEISVNPMQTSAEMRYISGLLSLLRDIDEPYSQKVSDQLIQNGCSYVIEQRIKSITCFTLKDFFQYEILDIKVFEHKQIKTHYAIRMKLAKWLANIPKDDLSLINRIYIVPREDQNYGGYYVPIFFSIKLVWDGPYSRFSPVSWLAVNWMEVILYHEIGHHAHRHSFGQIAHQEEEANDYASHIYVSNRPVLHTVLRYYFSSVGFLSSIFRKRVT